MGLVTESKWHLAPRSPKKQTQEFEVKFRNPPRTEKTEVEATVTRGGRAPWRQSQGSWAHTQRVQQGQRGKTDTEKD